MRHTMRFSLATIVGAAALASIGCTEYTNRYRASEPMHLNTSWAPYTSEYGPNTGVTGSSASPYVGGGIINRTPAPSPAPATRVETTTPATRIETTTPAPATRIETTTTTIRRSP